MPDFDTCGMRQLRFLADQALDLIFQCIGKIEPVPIEPLDAVILHRVVRSTYHHGSIRFIQPHKISQSGRWNHANVEYISADRADAGRKCSNQHVSGTPRIRTHENARVMHLVCKHICASSADLH